MKVKDFLKEFEGADPEADISFFMEDGCCGDQFILDEPWIDYPSAKYGYVLKDTDKPYCFVRFSALDFLNSCRSSSVAQSAVQAMRNKK